MYWTNKPVGNYLRLLKAATRRRGWWRHRNGAGSRQQLRVEPRVLPGITRLRTREIPSAPEILREPGVDLARLMDQDGVSFSTRGMKDLCFFCCLFMPHFPFLRLYSYLFLTPDYCKGPRIVSQNNVFASSEPIIRTANTIILYCLTQT